MKKKKIKDNEHSNGECLLEVFLKTLFCLIWFFMLPVLKVFKIIDISWNDAFITVSAPLFGASLFIIFTTIYNGIEDSFRKKRIVNEKKS